MEARMKEIVAEMARLSEEMAKIRSACAHPRKYGVLKPYMDAPVHEIYCDDCGERVNAVWSDDNLGLREKYGLDTPFPC